MNTSQLNEQLERDNCKLRLINLKQEQEIKNLWSAIRAHETTSKNYEQLTNELKLELVRAEREDQKKTQKIIDLDDIIKKLQSKIFTENIIHN